MKLLPNLKKTANATENIQADDGKDEAEVKDKIWADFWTALKALKQPKPRPLKRLIPTGISGASSTFNFRNDPFDTAYMPSNAFTMAKGTKWCTNGRL